MPTWETMTNERLESDRPLKKTKLNGGADMDIAANPYLAHMNQYDGTKAYYPKASSSLSSFKRNHTTVKDANTAENGPLNPFKQQALK